MSDFEELFKEKLKNKRKKKTFKEELPCKEKLYFVKR